MAGGNQRHWLKAYWSRVPSRTISTRGRATTINRFSIEEVPVRIAWAVVGCGERTGDYFYSSATRRRAERMISSSRYKPAARNTLSRSPAEGMTPRCLARSTTPSVPMSGMSKARAQARVEPSSSTAVQGARSRATPRTAVSPGPKPPLQDYGGNAAGSDSDAPATLHGMPGRVGGGSGLDLQGHRHRQQKLA